MEKRTIVAIALSILVFIGFQYYQQRYLTPANTGSQTVPSQKSVEAPASQAPAPTQSPAQGETPSAAPSAAPISGDTNAQASAVVIEGDLYRAVVDNRGGVLRSWELKRYHSASHPVFEMVAKSDVGPKQSLPGSLLFRDPALTSIANNQFYEVSLQGATGGSVLKAPVVVSLTLTRGDLVIKKSYRFEKDNYLLDLSTSVEKGGKELDYQFFLGQDVGPEDEHLADSTPLQAVYYSGGKARRESPPDENELKRIEGDIRWVGLDMKYFSMIAIPSRTLPYFEIQHIPLKNVAIGGEKIERELLRITTPVNGALQYQMYLGPKKRSDLESVRSADITGVIDYGMFTVIVLPLLVSLKWLYQFVPNYGWAIIILTFLLSLLLFPFRLKSMLSMKKMQAVQPKVKAIQEKYKRYKKTDPKRAEMNQEVMALYKEHGVNPLGGCLPLLLQFPLLIAFYNLLAYSIELRQAPFIWWLKDLSAMDSTYVLPVLMGISMFISQKMTPMTPGADPMQAKMMMIMPVALTFFFINVSSGLNLYFLCSNIFQIVFQKIAERWIGDGKSKGSKKS